MYTMTGPPILLPTPKSSTTARSTTPTKASEATAWTWWTPSPELNVENISNINSDDENDWLPPTELESLFQVETQKNPPWENHDKEHKDEVINKETTEKITTVDDRDEVTASDDFKTESVEIDTTDYTHGEIESTSERITNGEKDNHHDMKDKYLKLVEHNTRLVDVLRSTLELQANLFKRIIRYLFP